MEKQRKVSIGLCLLATVLSGTTRMQASFAEDAGQSANRHIGSHSLSASSHRLKFGDRGTRASMTVGLGVRNAIGGRVAPQSVIQTSTAPLQLHAPVQAPSAVPSGMNGRVPAIGAMGSAGAVRLNSGPTGTPLNRSAIGGAAMIRPSVAPHGIGGPANGLAGINGTTLRRKH